MEHETEQQIQFYRYQNYVALRQECLTNGTLFVDPYFPATDRSIFYTKPLPRGTRWMRPHEIVERNYRPKRPEFIVEGAKANDLDQGYLGNCWFIAGCIAVTFVDSIFQKVVPRGQICDGSDYAGIFHFRFWIYGSWYDVVIDDYLPVYEDGRLIFCHNTEEPNEFWAALLEKAFAKISGSYENLEGGFTADALIPMTGGIEETLVLKDHSQKDIWKLLVQSRKKKSMCGAYMEPDPVVPELKLPNNLIKGHAYIITKTATINTRYGEECLIRIRNPWGKVEWNGRWADNSFEWSTVNSALREKLLLRQADGEFWMNLKDFYDNFDSIQFTHLTPSSVSDEVMRPHHNPKVSWKMTFYHGEWIPGYTAGGCGNYNNSFWTNPQYLVKITDVDKEDYEDKASIIISLLQKYTREKRTENHGRISEDFIQFRVYKVRNPNDLMKSIQTGEKLQGQQLERIGNSGDYINKREVVGRFRLSPGYYMIIPSLFEANKSGHFLLRVFTEELLEEPIIGSNDSDFNSEEVHFENQLSVRSMLSQNVDKFRPLAPAKVERKSFSRQYGAALMGDAVDKKADNMKKIDLTAVVFMIERIHADDISSDGANFECRCKRKSSTGVGKEESDRSGIRGLIWMPEEPVQCNCKLRVHNKKQCNIM